MDKKAIHAEEWWDADDADRNRIFDSFRGVTSNTLNSVETLALIMTLTNEIDRLRAVVKELCLERDQP